MFLRGYFAVALNACMCLQLGSSSATSTSKDRILWNCPEVAIYFFLTYRNNAVIAKTDVAVTRFTWSSNIFPTEYVRAVQSKLLGCGEVYDEYSLNGIVIECFHVSIRRSMRFFQGMHPEWILSSLARHATSPLALQKWAYVFHDKRLVHLQNIESLRGWRENFSTRVSFIKMRDSAAKTTRTTIALAVMQIGSNM